MTWTPQKPDPCGPDCTCHATRTPMDEIGGVGSADRTLPDRPVQQPMWIREDNGDLVQVWVEETEETPSDRLPAPQPERYSTGRVPLPPVPEESYPPGAVDLPVEYADDLDVIAQANPSLGRRVEPSAFRRIFNAARRNT